ncbi:MAG: Rieske 2Fe-2S domain-containing protein [Chloroflexota bacterium]|nr:Rieske 2Fe-2S domain-containing protein [Chloroflexota bacterium]
MKHYVAPVSQIPDGQRLITTVNGRSIGIFNVKGKFYALRNVCPHKQAPLCLGSLGGTMVPTDRPGEFEYGLEDRVLRCPWHGWEFDIATGKALFGISDRRVATYPVEIEDDKLYVEMR